ncbi:Protein of unknown function (DUF3099) [Stackebrandtia albiflava]|uniref:DUF3099 family protein n=1 Tax=Stackebrandtia albiflava TaxID=406432 RepID=A0A562VBI6_9ACTN|nr:DUF3099 domain-containing protein [Stackebrandtia albiflava]TWJ15187.1 Protein of unknown function (DUF3099) [Stackebrandtia albiflava]
MAHSQEKPALITDAQPSPAAQLRSRQVRYIVMMGIRALLLVVATVLVMSEVPMLWLWLLVCAVGMVLLPWMAVLIANDRPAKRDRRLFRRHHRPAETADPALESRKPPRVIDVDS